MSRFGSHDFDHWVWVLEFGSQVWVFGFRSQNLDLCVCVTRFGSLGLGLTT